MLPLLLGTQDFSLVTQSTALASSNLTFRVRLCLRRDEEEENSGLLFDVIPEGR